MQVTLDVTPEAINSLVADAVVKSAIGTQLEAAVNRVLNDLTAQHNNPMDAVIRQYVVGIIRDTIENHHRSAIESMVRARLSERLTSELVDRIVDSAAANLTRP